MLFLKIMHIRKLFFIKISTILVVIFLLAGKNYYRPRCSAIKNIENRIKMDSKNNSHGSKKNLYRKLEVLHLELQRAIQKNNVHPNVKNCNHILSILKQRLKIYEEVIKKNKINNFFMPEYTINDLQSIKKRIKEFSFKYELATPEKKS